MESYRKNRESNEGLILVLNSADIPLGIIDRKNWLFCI